jgi:hypothetical protein
MTQVWISVENELPSAGERVQVRGYDTLGEWRSIAWWVPYKGRPPKGSRRHGRWIAEDGKGNVFRLGGYADIDHWRKASVNA